MITENRLGILVWNRTVGAGMCRDGGTIQNVFSLELCACSNRAPGNKEDAMGER